MVSNKENAGWRKFEALERMSEQLCRRLDTAMIGGPNDMLKTLEDTGALQVLLEWQFVTPDIGNDSQAMSLAETSERGGVPA